MRYQDLPKGMGGVPKHHLTIRQEYIWREMLDFQFVNKRPPTVREIRNALGVVSTNGVNDHLRALIKKDFVERRGVKCKARTIVAVDPTYVPTAKGWEACG